MRQLRTPLLGGTYEVSARITGQQLLAAPTRAVDEAVKAVLGRALALSPVELHYYVFMSNHFHMLLTVKSSEQLSAFMQFVNGNLARALNRVLGRNGAVWERRFSALPVASDEATLVARLGYLVAHGVKEDLVERPQDWPGATALGWLTRGAKLVGKWVDRVALFKARRRDPRVREAAHTTRYPIELTPLPCWRHLTEKRWRRRAREVVRSVEAEQAERRELAQREVLGPEAVVSADPFHRVPRSKRRRSPLVLAVDPGVRRIMRAIYRTLQATWRQVLDAGFGARGAGGTLLAALDDYQDVGWFGADG
jgi:REP element-mobilizing transposase RayT